MTLLVFFGLLLASARKWIPQNVLPLQSVLVLGSLVFLVAAMLDGRAVTRGELFAVTTLHPITSTLAGFILAGAVEAAGGFKVAARLLLRAGRWRGLGMSGSVCLLVNLPTVFAMPCGRVWAAALMPLAVFFGRSLAERTGNPALAPAVVIGFILNAAASCGPSPLGGIGMMGEGMAGFLPGSFADHMQFAIMLATTAAMYASVKIWGITGRPLAELDPRAEEPLPESAYFSFAVFFGGMAALFLLKPPVPIQAVLLAMTVAVMLVGKVSLESMASGIMFHPVTAMIAGFMMAGSLVVTGGFDALTDALLWTATKTPLGFVGVSVILIYLPTLFPMPCGRILSTSLLPGVLLFGQEVGYATGNALALPAILVPFLLSCAASCGPSPLGGIGGIGEGHLRLRGGATVLPQQWALLAAIPFSGLSVFVFGLAEPLTTLGPGLLLAGTGVVCGMATNRLVGYSLFHPGGLLGGLLAGIGMAVL